MNKRSLKIAPKTGVDYYPFGMTMSGRSWQQNQDYRFGFQGQEEDKELYDGAVSYKYRIHDPRIGRFLSIDPLSPKYPFYTPYSFSGNRVIDRVELEGLEPSGEPETWERTNEENHGNGVVTFLARNKGTSDEEGWFAVQETNLDNGSTVYHYNKLSTGSWSKFYSTGPQNSTFQSDFRSNIQIYGPGTNAAVNYMLEVQANMMITTLAVGSGGAIGVTGRFLRYAWGVGINFSAQSAVHSVHNLDRGISLSLGNTFGRVDLFDVFVSPLGGGGWFTAYYRAVILPSAIDFSVEGGFRTILGDKSINHAAWDLAMNSSFFAISYSANSWVNNERAKIAEANGVYEKGLQLGYNTKKGAYWGHKPVKGGMNWGDARSHMGGNLESALIHRATTSTIFNPALSSGFKIYYKGSSSSGEND